MIRKLLVLLATIQLASAFCNTITDYPSINAALTSNSSVTVETQLGGILFRPAKGPSVVNGGPNVTRGLFWIPDSEVAGPAYAPYCRRVAEAGYFVFLLTDLLCLPESARHVLFAATIQSVMTEENLQYWAVAGHGAGAQLAVQQLLVYHPRVHGLVLLHGDGNFNVSDKRAVTFASTGSVSPVIYNPGKYDNHTYFQTVVNSSQSDYAFTLPNTAQKNSTYSQVSGLVVSVMGLLHFPSQMAEVWRYISDESAGYPRDNPDVGHAPYFYDAVRGWHVFGNVSTAKTGYVFYVGAAVPETAYFGWASQVAGFGYLVVLPKFPMNYATLDTFVADRVIAAYPTVSKWAVGGHSFGSVAVQIYLTLRAPGLAPPPLAQPKLRGVAHLAGALTVNLTTTTLKFAQVYGSNDLPVSGDPDVRYQTSLLPRLPVFDGTFPYFSKVEGGNHGYMGWYDEPHQVGDGPAFVSREYQQQRIVDTIVKVLSGL